MNAIDVSPLPATVASATEIADAEVVAAVRVFGRLTRVLGRLDTGLTFPQYRLLTLLADGNERSTAIAHHLAVSKPTITAAVEALVELDYLRRKADSGDRRVTWLEITEPGAAALDRANAAYVERFGPLVRAMSDPAGFVGQLSEFSDVLHAERDGRRAADTTRDHQE